MEEQPSDLVRLIHESLEQLGWEADAAGVADRVKRLNRGLPLEDEFSIICGWLGKCELVHKLDQQQFPLSSKERFQVPDLLARIQTSNESHITVLIEVKSSNKNVLSFRPDYFSKLKSYGDLLGCPILIAWKRLGIWSLVDLDVFEPATKNFNLNFNDALKHTLMGKLLGDFAFTLQVDSGIHISFKKESVETVDIGGERQESWNTIIDNVYFTNGEKEEINDISSIAQQVFYSFELVTTEYHSDSHITVHNVVDEESLVFAHMALSRILSFYQGDQAVHWRHYLSEDGTISSISDFRQGVEESLTVGIVKYIIDVEPKVLPNFLCKN